MIKWLPCIIMLSGCSHWTHWGQFADVGTTAAGLSQGLSEANPLMQSPAGLAAGITIKLSLPVIARKQKPELCKNLIQSASAVGWGAATANLLTIAGIINSLPISIGLAGITMIIVYKFSDQPTHKLCYTYQKASKP